MTLDRILEVENVLSEWWDSANLSDSRQYFGSVLMESVYRADKGSYKIRVWPTYNLSCTFYLDSYFARLSLRYLDVKTGKRVRGTIWIDVDPYIYPLLGGEIFFYCTLTP